MVLIKEIELALKPDSSEVRAQEDEILVDSVLELANTDFTHVDEYEDVTPGSIRKHVEADMRVAYPGKPTSRKRIFKPEFNEVIPTKGNMVSFKDEVGDSVTRSDSSYDEGESSDDEISPKSVAESSSEEQISGSEKSDEDLNSDFDDSILPDEKEESAPDSEEDGNESDLTKGFDIFSSRTRNINADIAKGKSIRNQLTIWEKLIECRIKLQPTLLNANKLYQKDSLQDFKANLSPKEEEIVNETYSTLADVMKVLLQLQENLLNLSPEYHQLKSQKRKLSDEIIVSESEQHSNKKAKTNRKNLLEELHDQFKTFRNASIQKWNEKTRLSSGKINKNDFSAFDLPTLKQIEEILLDRERLLKRTRTKRSDYAILGKQEESVPEAETNYPPTKNNSNECDPEIFDDDDFYHKLLRDFIEKKTSDVTDSTKRGKQWLELQKLRNRMKSKVDTRASKGRKLRFTVHNKMVNFMAPVPTFTWTNEARNDLFKSLFH